MFLLIKKAKIQNRTHFSPFHVFRWLLEQLSSGGALLLCLLSVIHAWLLDTGQSLIIIPSTSYGVTIQKTELNCT